MSRPTLTTLAASALLALMASKAHALEQQQTATGSLSAVTATSNNGNSGGLDTKSTNVTIGTVNKFDTTNGVLTGVSASLSGVEVKGTGVAAARTAGVSWTLGSNAPVTSQITAPGSLSVPSNTFAGLAAFAGSGTVGATAAYTVTADRNVGVNGEAKTFIQNGSVTQTVTYSYLQHANASFGAAADVNSLALTAGSGFNVYALAGSQGAAHTTTLDSVSYSCISGNCGAFTFSLASFSNLAAGSYVAGLTGFNTTTAGSYSANYLFTFTDHAGIGVGQQTNTLSLSLNGTVAAVPEPESYAMMMMGLAAVGFMARRRKKSA